MYNQKLGNNTVRNSQSLRTFIFKQYCRYTCTVNLALMISHEGFMLVASGKVLTTCTGENGLLNYMYICTKDE